MKGQLNSAMSCVPKPEKATQEIDYVRWLQQMQTDLAETLGGVLLRGARPVQIGTAEGATIRASASPGRLVGWSIRTPVFSADPGAIKLRDGDTVDDPVIAVINIPEGQSVTQWMAPGGISFQHGLYVEILAGAGLSAVEGALFLGGAE